MRKPETPRLLPRWTCIVRSTQTCWLNSFGAPMRLSGDDYEELAKQIEEAVRIL
jgi:hypothetical protein